MPVELAQTDEGAVMGTAASAVTLTESAASTLYVPSVTRSVTVFDPSGAGQIAETSARIVPLVFVMFVTPIPAGADTTVTESEPAGVSRSETVAIWRFAAAAPR